MQQQQQQRMGEEKREDGEETPWGSVLPGGWEAGGSSQVGGEGEHWQHDVISAALADVFADMDFALSTLDRIQMVAQLASRQFGGFQEGDIRGVKGAAEGGEGERYGRGERGREGVEGEIDVSGGERERESVVYAAARKRAKGVLRETMTMLLEREGARGGEEEAGKE